jgi:hypothetical protein
MTIRGRTMADLIGEAPQPEAQPPKPSIDPPYYKIGGIEVIDYMEAKASPEEFKGHLRLTAIKYLSRAGHKGNILIDLKKAQWYINKLIETLEK